MKNLVGGKPEEKMKQRLWPVHCVQSTPGSDFIDEIDINKVDLVIHKGMDARVEMYSAFSDSFGNLTAGQGGVSHDLESILKDKGISHVYVVGLAGDYCVKVSIYFLYECVAVWPRFFSKHCLPATIVLHVKDICLIADVKHSISSLKLFYDISLRDMYRPQP
jgi:hypothetical protein